MYLFTYICIYLEDDNSPLTSYDGSEIKDSQCGNDIVLEEGNKRLDAALLFFKNNNGKCFPYSKTIFCCKQKEKDF